MVYMAYIYNYSYYAAQCKVVARTPVVHAVARAVHQPSMRVFGLQQDRFIALDCQYCATFKGIIDFLPGHGRFSSDFDYWQSRW